MLWYNKIINNDNDDNSSASTPCDKNIQIYIKPHTHFYYSFQSCHTKSNIHFNNLTRTKKNPFFYFFYCDFIFVNFVFFCLFVTTQINDDDAVTNIQLFILLFLFYAFLERQRETEREKGSEMYFYITFHHFLHTSQHTHTQISSCVYIWLYLFFQPYTLNKNRRKSIINSFVYAFRLFSTGVLVAD